MNPKDTESPGSIPDGYKPIPGPGYFSQFTGPFLYRKTEEGDFIYGFQSDQRHANTNENIHGGMLYTFADQFTGLYVAAAAKGWSTTVSLKANYLSPGRVGDFIEGRAILTKLTRSLAFAKAEVHVGSRILMTAEGVWKLFDGPSKK